MVNSEESETLPKTSNGNGNGPRVSFNRDVHVKRYGSLLNNDTLNCDPNSRSQSPNLRREFVDLSDAAALEREAALVLEQVNNFGSLPHRKHQQPQHLKKSLRRSKSDASSSKKAKRNSIFNFFNNSAPTHTSPSPASTNTNQANSSVLHKKPATNVVNNNNNNDNKSGNKKVARSKSDSSSMQKRDKYRNKVKLDSSLFNGNVTSSDSSDNNNAHLTNSLKKKKIPLSPISEVNTPLELGSSADYFSNKHVDTTNERARLTFKSCENLPQISPVNAKVVGMSKSIESLHSSQLPAEKPPLTKNFKVDKMVKRLSMERLSPPPANVLQAGGFSYTNPQLSPKSPLITLPSSPWSSSSPNKLTNSSYSPPPPVAPPPPHAQLSLSTPVGKKTEQSNSREVVYTQVACNETNADAKKAIQSHETVPNTQKRTSRESASPTPHIPSTPTKDFNDQFINLAPTPVGFADRDETDNNVASAVNDDEEPIIRPNIRKQIPRYASNSNIDHANNYYLDNEFDRLHDMRETDFNGIDASLSSRREILESRIKSRIGGGLHHHHQHVSSSEHHHTPRSSAHPPTTKHPPQQQQQQRYNHTHGYGTNEIISRYSPERKHEYFKSTSPPPSSQAAAQSTTMAHENGLSRRSSHRHAEKTTDSGNETDHVARRNHHNRRYSSRFNIGRKWNYEDDIIECELFLMKERKHTEETYPYQLVRTYVYRQHSNNDDQYDTDQDKRNILKEWRHNKKMTRDFLKSQQQQQKKKKSGLEKVRELFKSKKSSERSEENELKARYREYSPEKIEPPQKMSTPTPSNGPPGGIGSRRRLSTPQASPIIPNRSKSLPPKIVNRNIAHSNTSTLKKEKENGAQKFNWFASLERLSRRKSRDPADASTIDRKPSITRSKSSSMKNVSVSNGSSKTLRFFGDTDADETDSIRRLRSSRESREKSSSLQNLNSSRKSRQSKSISRSRQELLNIAESTSDELNTIEKPIRTSRPVSPAVNKFIPPPRPPKSSKLVSSVSSTLPRAPPRKKYGHEEIEEEISYREPHDSLHFQRKKNSIESDSNFSSVRRLRESLSVSRENLHRDRFDSDVSQRSVVYLHASVVGDIPSQTLGRRMSGKSSVKTAYQEEQPIARTVNRSFSVAAPWKPKFISDGYEINYNNDQQKAAYNSRNRYRSKSATREREKSRWDRRI